MTVWSILAAAGEGSRLGSGPKAFVELGGVPMFVHSLLAFAEANVDGIVVVVPEGLEAEARSAAAAAEPSTLVQIVPGGASRQDSVRVGLETVPADAGTVVVHDAARPLVTAALVERAIAALDRAAGAVVAVPLRDTLKSVTGDVIGETIPRSGVFRAQTPQAFRAEPLRAAHARAAAAGFAATDDAMLLERIGERVVIVPGDERNLKVTTPEDLMLAEALLAASKARPRP
jgi:2-C-methyl-D-erythritol 4-phosphate cytidylyltransferase